MLKKSVLSAIFILFFITQHAQTCKEAVCGSIVSKCLLTESCKCDPKNTKCYKRCVNCLSYLYNECCSCVDVCSKTTIAGKKSIVEDLNEQPSGLFDVLNVYPDSLKRWNTTIFPIDIEVIQHGSKQEVKIHMRTSKKKMPLKTANAITLNCTVSFWSKCMSWMKCKSSCHLMGASSYRWFHDGCCECVGHTCINYGINESRCHECS